MINHNNTIQDKFYRVKLTDYGHNGELSFWYDEPLGRAERRLNQLIPLLRSTTQELNEQQPDPDAETNLERAFRKAKSKVRKLIMTMQADRILTLTYKDNMTCRDTANKHFVRFIKKVHAKYPDFKYVSVAEVQKRGAWHFHIAVSGWQDVGFLRSAWNSITTGAINVTSPKTKGDKAKAAPQISAYLTKYMTKAFTENHELGKYRYRSSNGIDIKQAIFWISSQTWANAIKDSGNLMSELYGQIGSSYLADDWNNGWFASWSLSTTRTNSRIASRITS